MRLQQLRRSDYDPAVASLESARLRQRHSDHILDLLRAGISMRTIRRHRLDDPRLIDEVRAMLVQAATARQSKAHYRRPADERNEERLATLIRLGPITRNVAATQFGDEGPEVRSPAAAVVPDPPALKEAIQAIRRLVCEHFYLREMRDPELMVRSNRRAYVLPRQLAMYITRQLTGATLQEIGREFGGNHHSTVLHAISKIEATRRANKALDGAIVRLTNDCSLAQYAAPSEPT